MKFSQKIFLVTFILSIISIFSISYVIIFNSNKMNITNAVENQINNSNAMIQLVKYMDNNLNPLYTTMDITGFINGYVDVGIYEYVEILQKDKYSNMNIIYSNLVNDELNDVMGDIYNSNGKVINKIVNIDGKDLLFICNSSVEDYILVTSSDISNIYNIKENNIELVKKITLISFSFIAVILYIFINLLTKRMDNINKALIEFSKGNYKKRLYNFGNDEIGMLANGFNMMSSAIEINIDTINEEAKNKQDFINNITHELRTPLTSIIGYSSLLLNANITDKNVEKQYIRNIYEEGKYIENISDKLMDLILLNNANKHFEKLNLSELIKNIVYEIKETISLYDVIIKDDIVENIIIYGDKDLIKSLILNIITNAINSYKNNGDIFIALYDKGILKIIDRGRGIAAKDLNKIREPFYTTNKSRNKKLGGLGLGLTLCYNIIEMHDGRIEINSEVGKGTEVIIKFREEIEYEKSNEKP